MSIKTCVISFTTNYGIRAITLLFSSLWLAPSVAHAADWVILSDFENFALGSAPEGDSGFTDAFTSTVVTNDFINGGERSARTSTTAGCTCFGAWGGEIQFPPLSEGEEVWLRVYLYFPQNFDFTAPGGIGLKTLRLHRRSSGGNNEGYVDVLIRGNLVIGNEVQWPDFVARDVGSNVPRGQWHAVELYVRLHSSPGQGAIRVWQNGALVYENASTQTLKSSTSKMDFFYLFSYWNGGAPRTQSAYIDDIAISATVPSNIDASGNPFIGLGSFTAGPPRPRPLPPNLTVE